ncbi:Phosphatidylinositol4phosphate5kinase, partial [Globisporangium splendens]
MNGRANAYTDRDSTRSSDGVIERHPVHLPHERSFGRTPGRGPAPPPPPGPPPVQFDVSSTTSSSSSSLPGFQDQSPARKPPTTRGGKPSGSSALHLPMADSLTSTKNKPSPVNASNTFTTSMLSGGIPATGTGNGQGASAGPGSNYTSMQTPIETKKKTPAMPLDLQVGRDRLDESSEDSYDNGSYLSEKIPGGMNGDGDGWFHAKIKVDNSIQWANNYKIQLMMFLMLIGGVAVTLVFANNSAEASVGLFCGSVITLISCSSVVYTFLTRPTWRKHPNPIIFFRSLCDIGLVSVLLVTELYKCESIHGLQAQCATVPHVRVADGCAAYFAFNSLTTAIILVSIPDFAGPSEFGYCWTDSKSKLRNDEPEITEGGNYLWKLNFQSWALFYIWLILFWCYAIIVIYWAYKRLHSGLSETLRMRLRVLHSVTIYVIAIIIYWAFTFFVYVPYLIQTEKTKEVTQMMNFMITCKGYFDFAVWFQMNEFHENRSKGDAKKTDIDVDVDLSPQVNIALRCEVLYYTTTGIIQAVRDTQHLPPGANQQELYLQPQGTEENRASLGVDEYMIRTRPKAALSKGTLFIDYCPHTFQTIREHFGVDTNQYIESLSRTTKERLSEGASGAFMFFSHDQQLIVKSMSDEESAFLRSIAPEYASFLLTNPDSLLTRFYGCHAIRLYGKTFNFVVMANLFSTDKIIHRRYDIKGSWVNRSAKHPSKGKRVTCRHCNAKYVFGSTDAENCPAQVGRHEPNVVLKDNDLTARVRLDPKVAEELYDQLVKDANFLSRLGIMDYSLLLGVHNVEYMVNPDLAEEVEESSPALGGLQGKNRTSAQTDLTHRSGKGRASNPTANSPPRTKQRAGLPRFGTGTRRANTVVGPSIYYFGLIDILQQWTMEKKMERFAKTKLLGKDTDGLSALPPTAYCDRFKRKMGEILSVTVRNEYDEIYDERRSDGHRRFM